jgi:hypothetical protein
MFRVVVGFLAACLALSHAQVQPTAIEGAYGRLMADARVYKPLDKVTVRIEGRAKGDSACRIRVADPNQRTYFETDVALTGNRGQTSFVAGGALGAHYIYLWFPGEKRYSRYLNFQLDAETAIESGDVDFDGLYRFTRDAMRLGRRQYETSRGRFVGYISADTWHFDGIWLRDWIYGLPAYRYWETEMSCGIDRFLEQQKENGQVPDGIERDGRTWRVGLESDVEYIMTLGVWQTWQATGDNAWLERALPHLERALNYIRTDPKHWDEKNQLVKRQHSCDTWDYDIDGARDHGTSRHVVATCDQSGYYQAFRAMERMYEALGKREQAARWASDADAYRARAVALLWDGTKFLHHAHLDPSIEHGDFDERAQLAMGNTWAMTRGLATGAQARSIIGEYRRRHKQTGDAYPWWSLQPGYPDRLGYWKEPYRLQGGYANGGLMPWVGGELCRAAFLFGRETYGVELLRQYTAHLRRIGGAQVWYWPNGTPGFRTTNEVPYAGWGMAQWVDALVNGLAGVRDLDAKMRKVEIAPRWAATGDTRVRAVARYAASDGYAAYRMTLDRAAKRLDIEFTGSGESAEFRVLLPEGRRARSVTAVGQAVAFAHPEMDSSRYVTFSAKLAGVGTASIELE